MLTRTPSITGASASFLTRTFAEYLRRPPISTKLLALLEVGSTAEGLGTGNSDLDLIAIVTKLPAWRPREKFVCFEHLGVSYELMLYSATGLRKVAADSGRGFSVGTEIREAEIQYRLLMGRRLYIDPGSESLFASFDPAAFTQNLVGRHQEGSFDAIEDMYGCLSVGRVWPAAEFARGVARSAIDSFLVSRGDGYPKSKWRLDRLMRTGSAAAVRRYLQLEFGTVSAVSPAAATLVRARALKLAMLATRASMFRPEDVADAIGRSRRLRATHRLSSDAVAIHARGGWLAFTPAESFQLDPLSALALLLFAGGPVFEGVTIPEDCKFQESVATTSEALRKAFGLLAANGLILAR